MLEQMYTDFTTKLLPQIQSGLAITKDYFLDLFSRYVKYLIVSDSVKIFLGFLLILGSIIGIKNVIKWVNKQNDDGLYSILIIFLIPIGIGCALFFCGISDLIKDIYIPEVRIIEILSNFTK